MEPLVGFPPLTRSLLVVYRRWYRVLDPGAQLRLTHDPGVPPLQPLVPPAQALLQEADLRAGAGEVRVLVRPRADQALGRRFQVGEQAGDGVGVGVGPAADGVGGGLDRAIVLADRAMLPIIVAQLVLQPGREEGR